MTRRRTIALLILTTVAVPVVAFYRSDIPVAELERIYADERSAFVEVDGMRVHYRDEGAGPPIVLLHGTNSSLHTWEGWVQAMRQQRRVITLDLPGYGLTGPDPQHRYSGSEVARFVRHFLDARGVGAVAVAGNSRGGGVAWNYACQFPEQTTALILVAPSGMPREESIPLAMRLQGMPGASVITTRITPRFLVASGLRDAYADPSLVTDELVDRYLTLLLREGNRGAVSEMVSAGHSTRDPACLRELNMPTLIQWGGHDRFIPPKYAAQFEEAIRGAELIMYPNLGHIPMEEAPERTVADALRFLDEHAETH